MWEGVVMSVDVANSLPQASHPSPPMCFQSSARLVLHCLLLAAQQAAFKVLTAECNFARVTSEIKVLNFSEDTASTNLPLKSATRISLMVLQYFTNLARDED